MRRRSKRKPSKILSEVGRNTSVENKLNHQAMLLSYEFDYGIDFKRRVIKITEEIDQTIFDRVDGAMTEMEAQGRGDITIKINSPGGETYHAMAIVGRIKESSCKVVTKGYGHVMSAATLILASGTRKRLMSEDAFLMWHEASYELTGRHSENKATVKQIDREESLWARRMSEHSNRDMKFWLEHGIGKDVYFDTSQLLKLGVIDGIF